MLLFIQLETPCNEVNKCNKKGLFWLNNEFVWCDYETSRKHLKLLVCWCEEEMRFLFIKRAAVWSERTVVVFRKLLLRSDLQLMNI